MARETRRAHDLSATDTVPPGRAVVMESLGRADGSRLLLVDREAGSGRQDEVGRVTADGRRDG